MMKFIRFIPILFVLACAPTFKNYLLNEEFDDNKLGWVEEWTKYHHTKFVDGKLLLISIDTANSYTSNGPRNESVFWSLPSNWQFSTSCEIIDGGEDAEFGFILYSSSIQYIFSISRNGNVVIVEYDYNSEVQSFLVEKQLKGIPMENNQPIILDLKVREESFEFYINKEIVGKNTFRAKSWESLRLYASSGGTGIKSDYFRLMKLD